MTNTERKYQACFERCQELYRQILAREIKFCDRHLKRLIHDVYFGQNPTPNSFQEVLNFYFLTIEFTTPDRKALVKRDLIMEAFSHPNPFLSMIPKGGQGFEAGGMIKIPFEF